MKLDTPLTTDLAVGVARRIIDPGDSIVVIPSTILPTIESASISQVVASSAEVQRSSFLLTQKLSKNNAAAGFADSCTFGAGRWRGQMAATVYSNIATAITATQILELVLNIGASSSPAIWGYYLAAFNQMWVTQHQFEFALRNDTLMQLSFPATAVGDTILASLDFTALKLL